MASKESRPRAIQQVAETPHGIPDNPWIDDVGMLRDRKKHFEVDKLLTCHCDNCAKKANNLVETSFQTAFGKEMPENTGASVVSLYEQFIRLTRAAKREIPPIIDPSVIFNNKQR
jgi:hypothetical protein